MKTGMIVLLAFATPLFADSFQPPCKLPFAALSEKAPIDSQCGLSGSPKNTPALAAQDLAKDNFCASGTPVVLSFTIFPDMQAAAETALGGPSYKPPTSRSALHDVYTMSGKKIGEGTLTTMVGYVEAAHYSDVDDGESVNCELKGDQNNDIHIPIVEVAGADECSSVTAEISPHYRPAVWTASNVNKPKVPLRFTGQLLFDAEHRPCRDGKADGPKRQSVWEIHPVYAVDVCTANSISACRGDDASVWTPLDVWLKKQAGAKK